MPTHIPAANHARMWRLDHFHELEYLQAVYTTHEFPRHVHETYVIEAVEAGVDEFYCDGRFYTAPAGSVVLINPKEVHTGRVASSHPLRYHSLYPAPELLAGVSAQIDERQPEAPLFTPHVIRDSRLFALLQQVPRSCGNGSDRLACQSLIIEIFCNLIRKYASKPLRPRRKGDEETAAHLAKAYIDEYAGEPICLENLSQVCNLSPYHLLRCFRKVFGLPPHRYLTNVRIDRAKRRLADGASIAQVAYECGFCDQSHFTRHFKRIVGVTPGQYKR